MMQDDNQIAAEKGAEQMLKALRSLVEAHGKLIGRFEELDPKRSEKTAKVLDDLSSSIDSLLDAYSSIQKVLFIKR